MTNPDEMRKMRHILPGEWYVSDCGELIVTVLGSCVAVCLHDRRQPNIAGVNHFMLPGDGSGHDVSHDAGRFGVHSMELLITDLQRHGAARANLEAKVFGGGSVLDSVASVHVGERNVEFALDYLRREGIPVVAKDVLGPRARKLIYDTATHEARVKLVRRHEAVHVSSVEKKIVQSKPVTGTVELF